MPSKTKSTKKNLTHSKQQVFKPIHTLYEKVNKKILLRILSSPNLSSEEMDTLKKYKQSIINGHVPVNYNYGEGSNFGRLYAEGGLSMQSFRKAIRHALASDIYIDVDIVNTLPVLISQYCDKNGIQCELLKDYIENREERLDEIMNYHHVGRECAKELILKLCCLGNYTIEEEDIDEKDPYKLCCICGDVKLTYNYGRNGEDGMRVNVCDVCAEEARKRNNDNEGSYFGECLIELYNETWEIDISEDVTVENLTEIAEEIYACKTSGKLKRIEKFAAELRRIGKLIAGIEKEILDYVEKHPDKNNKYGSVLSLKAQILENDCLMAMDNFFTKKKFITGVYCFDGLMIERNDKKEVTKDLLIRCSKYVEKETGYKIEVKIKPMDLGMELPEMGRYVEYDKEVQEKLFDLEDPNYFRFCHKDFYVFNEKTGMYDTHESTLDHYIMKHKDFFWKEVVINDKRTILKNYGMEDELIGKAARFVKRVSRDDGWIDRTADTSLGYLLFNDGIYDMKKGTFTKGYDSSIVFHGKIPYDFPERNEEEIKYAGDMSFNLLFDDPMPLIVALARALAGDTDAKKFYFAPGDTNTGKSVFVQMFQICFGNYVGVFNAENLAYGSKYDTSDEAKKIRWALLVRFCRLLFSSEANMKKILNGNDIKKYASGRDKLIGRTHGKEEVSFNPHFTMFCMLNDIPKIDPMDSAVLDRLVYCEFKKQFVEKVKDERMEVAIDPKLNEKIHSSKFINGFIHIILDGYKYFLEKGQPAFDDQTKEQWTEEGRKDKNVADLIKNNFEITNDNADFISVADMNQFKLYHKKVFSTISPTRFNELIYKEFKIKQTKKNDVRGWVGIKRKTDE